MHVPPHRRLASRLRLKFSRCCGTARGGDVGVAQALFLVSHHCAMQVVSKEDVMPAVCSLAYSSSSRVQALCGDVLSAAASDKDGRGLISTPVRRKARMGVAHGDHSPLRWLWLRWLWLWQVQEALNHLLEARSTAVRSSSAVTLAKMSPGVFDPTTAAVGTCLAVLLTCAWKVVADTRRCCVSTGQAAGADGRRACP